MRTRVFLHLLAWALRAQSSVFHPTPWMADCLVVCTRVSYETDDNSELLSLNALQSESPCLSRRVHPATALLAAEVSGDDSSVLSVLLVSPQLLPLLLASPSPLRPPLPAPLPRPFPARSLGAAQSAPSWSAHPAPLPTVVIPPPLACYAVARASCYGARRRKNVRCRSAASDGG